MSDLNGKEYKRFENIKHFRDDGTEYWSARELAAALEYTQWRNFTNVGSTELIANLFRISQTEEKLRRDHVQGAEQATSTHYKVGREGDQL